MKEQGYESDNSLVVRKKNEMVCVPSPEYQKQAYLQVQAGGEPPLQGFRKQLPSRPKGELKLLFVVYFKNLWLNSHTFVTGQRSVMTYEV